jgi:hypothetical protein
MKIEQQNCGTKKEEQTSININPATASQLTVAEIEIDFGGFWVWRPLFPVDFK